MALSEALIKVGCCGFRSSRNSYYQLLPAVEVQHTFYQPPQISTLKRWRKEAPAEFEFTLKAWQLITHLASSPTYKRLKRELNVGEREGAGAFRSSGIVREAWTVTRACAEALNAKKVLFQCPASFQPTSENVENLLKFFGQVDRAGMAFCWEPRGKWTPELVKDLCGELDLWHVVDPFSATTVTPEKCYFRLHGRKGWRYTYEDSELEELSSMLPKKSVSYVFFNNMEMIKDAVRFRQIIGETS